MSVNPKTQAKMAHTTQASLLVRPLCPVSVISAIVITTLVLAAGGPHCSLSPPPSLRDPQFCWGSAVC